MDVGWGESRCIICLRWAADDDPTSVMTQAHVIPRSVGGALFAYNECKRCNERFGHGPEAVLVGDPAVRSAAEGVGPAIPDLIRRMRRRRVFEARSDTGVLVRAVADSESESESFKVLQARQPDGSRTASTDAIRAEIETTLRRRGLPDERISRELRRMEEAPDNAPVSIGGQFVIRKGAVGEFSVPFDDPLIPDVTLLGIAYRYLAGCIGSNIYDLAFQPIRDALTDSSLAEPGVWRVAPYWTRNPEPWHGLAVKQLHPHVIVYIRLFADLVWQVHFEQIALKSECGAPYRLDLRDGSEQFGG
jgi:HNH endonuclease